MIFKPISREEYDQLSFEQRLVYLQRLQADIAEKMADSRRQLEEVNRKLERRGD